jgi:hypothetical protein
MSVLAKGAVKQDDWASEGGHWYDASTGEAKYTIVGKNGNVRNTTLRDARTMNLVPSVTTIAQVEAKPQLTNWLVQQGMLACLTLPRLPGEEDTAFMARALEDSKQQTRKAAERGSYLHGLMEQSFRDDIARYNNEDDARYIEPVFHWIKDRFPGYTWSVERTIPTHLGYGGKIDLTGTKPGAPPATVDYKFKSYSDPTKKFAYPEYATQLAAYTQALYGTFGVCVNLFVSSDVPGLITPHEWDNVDLCFGWAAFQAMQKLWQARKRFA